MPPFPPLIRRCWLLLPLLVTGCPENGDRCPAEFKAGDPCEIVGLECNPPGSQCEDTLCVCSDEQAGGFFWDCSKVPYCKCTCPCGKIAINTCEALGCTRRAQDPCPEKASAVCAVVCAPPDAGPDLPPPDRGVDLLPDTTPDLDPVVDLPPPDLPQPDLVPDLPTPDQWVPDQSGQDGAGDTTPSPDGPQPPG